MWLEKKPYALFICLNPSTADENTDDPTIRRCVRYADSWGYGGMVMVNLYAYRSTDPKKLSMVSDPVGPDNDMHIRFHNKRAGITVAGWGTMGGRVGRSDRVLEMLQSPHYLELTKHGYPKHPLYLKKDLEPIPFQPTQ
jgi:hypothetical protein